MFEWIVSFITVFGLLYKWTEQIAVPHFTGFVRSFEHSLVFISVVLFLLIMLYVLIKQAKKLPNYYQIQVIDVFGSNIDMKDLRVNFRTYTAAKSYSVFYSRLFGGQSKFKVVGKL